MGDSINLPFPFQQGGDSGNGDQAPLPPSPAIPTSPPSNPLTDPLGAKLNNKNLLNSPLDEHINKLLLQSPSEYTKQRMGELFGSGKKGTAGKILYGLLSGMGPLQDRLAQEYSLRHEQLSTAVQAQHNQMQMQQAQGMMNFRMQKMQQDASIAEAKNSTQLLKAQLTSKYQTNLNDIREQARRDKWSSTRLANEEKQLNVDYLERSDHLAGEDGKLQAITSRMQDPDPQIAARGQQELQNWKFNLDYRARDFLLSHGTGTAKSTTSTAPDENGNVTTSSVTQKLTPPNNPLLGQGAGIVGPAMGAPQGGAGQMGQPPPQGQMQPQQPPPPPQQTYAQSAPLAASQTQSLMGGRQTPPGTMDKTVNEAQPSFGPPGGMINQNDEPGKTPINPGGAPSPINPTAINQPTARDKVNTLLGKPNQQQLSDLAGKAKQISEWTRIIINDDSKASLLKGNRSLSWIYSQVMKQIGMNGVDPTHLSANTRDAAMFAETVLTKDMPRIKDEISALQNSGKLGPLMGRWNEFMSGTYGSGDPEFTKLRADINLVNTALGRVHGGARGGGSPVMLEHFKKMASTRIMDAQTLGASLSSYEDWLNGYASILHKGDNLAQAPSGAKPKTADEFLKSIGR